MTAIETVAVTDSVLTVDPELDSAPTATEISTTSRWIRIRRSHNLWALIVYGVLGLAANLPTWPGDPSRLATCACGGNQDPRQTVWFIAWTPYAILHGHNPFVTNWINFPKGINLAQNTSMPLLGILAVPLTLLTNPVSSVNLLRWLAFPLSAYAMYYALRRVVTFTPAAFIGGLLYGFSPYMISQSSVHLNLSFVPLPPLIFYSCYELIVRQQRSAKRYGAMLGLLTVAQFFISSEVLATTGLIAGIALFFLFFTCIRDVASRWRHALFGLVIAAAILAVFIAYPFWAINHAPQHYVGPAQGYNQVYNADLLSAILPTSAQLVTTHRLAMHGSALVGGLANVDENGSYLGFPLLLLLGYVLVRYWRRLWIWFFALVAATTFVLSLGPRLAIDGKFHHLPINLPFRKINHLPFLENILPARFSLYVALCAAVIVAIGIDAYWQDVATRRAAMCVNGTMHLPVTVVIGRLIGGVLAIMAVVALIPRWPYRQINARPSYAESPKALEAIPNGATVLTYPFATPFTDDAMLWQALDGMRFKIIGSYALNSIGTKHHASTFPTRLAPKNVEAMLSNSLTPIPIPGIPPVVATNETVNATDVVVLHHGRKPAQLGKPTTFGMVENIDPAAGTFIVITKHSGVVAVHTNSATFFHHLEGTNHSFLGLLDGLKVRVYGNIGPGTVTPKTVQDLRTYITNNHVDAFLVELGRRDSALIVKWATEALGPPSRAGGGGELWLGLGAHRLR